MRLYIFSLIGNTCKKKLFTFFYETSITQIQLTARLDYVPSPYPAPHNPSLTIAMVPPPPSPIIHRSHSYILSLPQVVSPHASTITQPILLLSPILHCCPRTTEFQFPNSEFFHINIFIIFFQHKTHLCIYVSV